VSAVLFYLLTNLPNILVQSVYHELVPVETKKSWNKWKRSFKCRYKKGGMLPASKNHHWMNEGISYSSSVYERCPIRILAWTPAILSGRVVAIHFHPSNAGMLPLLRHDRLI